jgi:L-ribulose-5-phosphate 4-epimerase
MKQEVIYILKKLSDFTVGAEGNISGRTEKGFVIKPSGYGFDDVIESDLVECDINGNPFYTNKKPSMEVSFHSWLYKNSDYNYIAHTHPTNTLKILCNTSLTEVFANKRLFPDQVIYNGSKSCTVPYANPGKSLASAVDLRVKSFIESNGFFPKVILLQNHGIICVGKSAKECIYASQICEKSASIFLGACNTEYINYLSLEDIESLLADKNEKHRVDLLCQK